MAPSPFLQLQVWLDVARAAGVKDSSAMCLSTVGEDGAPSARMVLLRGLDERGLVFFTNYTSRKGRELADNPHACVTFWWGNLERQVRVEGIVELASAEESDAYFDSRPLDSRIASAASPQSQVVENREVLDAMVEALALKHEQGDIHRPSHWGGYRLVPNRFEFWQGRRARLHDRIAYCRIDGGWITERLAP